MPPSADQLARARGVEHGSAMRRRRTRGGAAGSVTIIRKSIRNSESPKLYSNRPAVSSATTAASAVAASSRCPARNRRQRSRSERDDEPQPGEQRREAALGRDLQGTLWRCGLICLHGVGIRVLARKAARPCSDRRRRRVAGSCARLRAASRSGRGGSGRSCRTSTEALGDHRRRERRMNIAATIGRMANSRKSFSANSSATAAHAPTAALRVKVSATATAERRHHQRRPRPIARANSTRAIATPMTSISRPEYVM